MFRKLVHREPKDTACPAYALGCDNCTPISVLKPEIVIEERRWVPYPMVIRHYIPRPKPKKFQCFRKLYRKCKEEWRLRAERREDKKRAKETAERIERERCLKELRRLHSYHQKLCCNTQSFQAFSKHVKKAEKSKSKFSCLPKCTSTKIDPEAKKSVKECQPVQFMCLRVISNIGCVLTLLSIIALTLFLLI